LTQGSTISAEAAADSAVPLKQLIVAQPVGA
jgi:hypothetical protein